MSRALSGPAPSSAANCPTRSPPVPRPGRKPACEVAASGPSRRGNALAALTPPRARRHRAFAVGVPELDAFPFELWSRLLAQSWRHPAAGVQSLGDPAGLPALRGAIARYLATARAVVCEADQVIVTSGAQQGISLACQVLLDAGETVLVEDPVYPGVLGAFAGAGVVPVPVPVDAEGFDVAAAEAARPMRGWPASRPRTTTRSASS